MPINCWEIETVLVCHSNWIKNNFSMVFKILEWVNIPLAMSFMKETVFFFYFFINYFFLKIHLSFFKDFIYLFMRDTHREAETQAEGEAGSMQGAQRGTWSRVSRIRPWAEGGAKPLSHPGCPSIFLLENGHHIVIFLRRLHIGLELAVILTILKGIYTEYHL